ncbi:tyrosinase family oxidase copper chaperone [Streptomyces sp. NEAU-NA10]|uniref:tyrosinase family oxidase copper chaperone n=1 Tax=Streptomyces sp. NEAU-NA10 TaxID=3416050 RepID=UPI003CC5E9DB
MTSNPTETHLVRAGDPVPLVGDPTEATGRRRVLWGLLASAAGAALAPVLVASRPAGPKEARFDETYRGRSIVGIRDDDGQSGEDASGTWHVTVDGRPLHMMRRVDGTWMTMVDHYQSYPTPLAAARAAVDELGPTTRLVPSRASGGRDDDGGTPGDGRETEGGHRHGVHA